MSILLYADYKTGKTPLTVDVAASEYFKNPILFLLDGGEKYHKFYKNRLGNKGDIFNLEQVEKKRQEIEKNLHGKTLLQIMCEKYVKWYHELCELEREAKRRDSTTDINKSRFGKLLAIEELLEEKNKSSKIDLVIIDCLLTIVGFGSTYTNTLGLLLF